MPSSSQAQTDAVPLCVDLDGTLVKTNTLVEVALALVCARPLAVFQIFLWWLRGHAYLWERLVKSVQVDVRQLPYRGEILQKIEEARKNDRPVFLVTGAHQVIAQQVGAHLGCFAGVFGTTAKRHLVGTSKRDLLVSVFGKEGFDYIGDSYDDESIFREARHATWLVKAGRRPKPEPPVTFVRVGPTSRVRPMLRALRPYQWSKNVLIFVPLILAHRLNDLEALTAAFITFVAFSLAASSAYCLNDLVDLDADRRHQTKRSRPVASGELSIQAAILEAVVLGVVAFLAAWSVSWQTFLVIALYAPATFAYSTALKRIVSFDVVVLSGLYALRLFAGSVATNIPLSPWTVTFSLFMFLSLALLKRFAELRNLRDKSIAASAGRDYFVTDLPQISALGTASGLISVLVIALYVNGMDVQALYSEPARLWLICPLVAAWVCRLWILVNRGELTEDPVLYALHDRCSWFLGVLVFAVLIWAA